MLLALAMLIGQWWPSEPDAGPDARPPERVETPAEPAQDRVANWMRPLAPGERPPQFVLFSFDGVGSHQHWQQVLDVAARSGAHITGFLSGTYLLENDQRNRYRGPGHAAGKSSIGFGGSAAEVATLIDDVNTALARGHEIGTHYNGHFCRGAEPSADRWSTAMWNDELDQFFEFIDSARNQGLTLDPATVRGGRTPCLEGNWDEAFPAMTAHGLTYDSSRTSNGIAWPTDHGGIREFWMPLVRVPALGKKVILMDYNLWFALNGARNEPTRAAEFTAAVLDAYRAAHAAAYNQNRAPLVIGNHFNDWSGGAFTPAVMQFMGEVCTRPETVCATYSEVSAWMDLQDPAVLAELRRRPNAQVGADA
ncbi:polysaccharide deacetylase [Pseudonocardia asaccharolytica]|uniref:Polysaccharide deacetylase n=1 Tax=Pseudonocardia asaccharolytica DSM 44247 = NBRC 16224 TaxID=1123024 RepID=A0A511D5P3_9PSEU|nr:polysaccharide deacetylase [Pseudonocardia asaccharolytica]GEL20111.1 hypothetical protein PA7_39480 [Pseudonocardia asaccharolytica DSM 44247 = NBRC 16224]